MPLSLEDALKLCNASYSADGAAEGYEVLYDSSVGGNARFVIYSDPAGNMTVAFKGTSTPLEALADVSVERVSNPYGRGEVHSGFLATYQVMRMNLRRQLELLGVTHPGSISFTGHSLGGAVAVLAEDDLGDTFNVNRLVTFGAPAVGDEPFTESLPDDISFDRVVNGKDAVAQSLDGKFGYIHGGRLVQLNHDKVIWSLEDHSLTEYGARLRVYDHTYDVRVQAEQDETWNQVHYQIVNWLGNFIMDGTALRLTVGGADLLRYARIISDSLESSRDLETGKLIFQIPKGTFWKEFGSVFGNGEKVFAMKAVLDRKILMAVAKTIVAERGMAGAESTLNAALATVSEESEVIQTTGEFALASLRKVSELGAMLDELAAGVRAGLVGKLGKVGEALNWLPRGSKLLMDTMMYVAMGAQIGMIGYEEYEAFQALAKNAGLTADLAHQYDVDVKRPFMILARRYNNGELSDSDFEKARAQSKAAHQMYQISMNFLLTDKARAGRSAIVAFDITGVGLLDALASDIIKDDFTAGELDRALNPLGDSLDDMKENFKDMYGEALYYNEDTRYWRIHQPVLADLAHRLRTDTWTLHDRVVLNVGFGSQNGFAYNDDWLEANEKFGATPDFSSDDFLAVSEDSEFGKRKKVLVDDLIRRTGRDDWSMSTPMDELLEEEDELSRDYSGEMAMGAHDIRQTRTDGVRLRPPYSAVNDPLYFIHREWRLIYLDGISAGELGELELIVGRPDSQSAQYAGLTWDSDALHDRPSKRHRQSDGYGDGQDWSLG